MKITCRKADLLNEVSKAVSFASTKNSLSMTSCVKLVASGENVTVMATDGKMCFKATIGADVHEDGELAVYVEKLYSVLKNMKAEEINIEYKDNNIGITSSGASRSVTNIKTLDASRFPEINMPSNCKTMFDAKVSHIVSMIDAVAFSASTDSSPAALTGVCMECVDGELRFVATNRRMMAMSSIPSDVEEIRDVKIPVKFYNAIKSIDDEFAKVICTESEIYVCTEKGFISSPLVSGMFPNYMKVIPSGNLTEFTVDVDEFINAVNLVSVMSNVKENKLFISLGEGGFVIHGSDDNFGDSRQMVLCGYEGPDALTALNSRLLSSVLKSIPTKNVRVSFRQADSAWKFVPEGMDNIIYVIMTMKV